jgi:hypothetical protein
MKLTKLQLRQIVREEIVKLKYKSINESKKYEKAKKVLRDFNDGKMNVDAMVKKVILALGFKFNKYSDEEAGTELMRAMYKGKMIRIDDELLDEVVDTLESLFMDLDAIDAMVKKKK